jgi:hypothetical protein
MNTTCKTRNVTNNPRSTTGSEANGRSWIFMND